jgi:hypothetical protein
LATEDAGGVRARLELKPQGGAPPLVVVETERDVYLAALGETPELSPLRDAELSYSEKVLGAELRIKELSYSVSAMRVDSLRRLLALGRVAPAGTVSRRGLVGSRYVEEPTEVEARFLGHWLDADEIVLAWLATGSSVDVGSEVGTQKTTWRFLLTQSRQALVAISAIGDVETRLLPDAAIDITPAVGRDALRAGNVEWHAPLLQEKQFAELAPLPALPGPRRVLEAARLCWRNVGPSQPDVTARPLRWLLRRGDPFATLVVRALSSELDLGDVPDAQERDEALLALAAEVSSAELLRVWGGFALTVDDGLEWLSVLLDRGDATRDWAVELHAGLREAMLAPTDDGFEEAAIDIAYAEHLLDAGRAEDATVVLEARLAALPSEELLDLLPPATADLTEGSGGQQFRIRILELLARSRGDDDKLHTDTVRELAQLQPLVPARVREFYEEAEGDEKRVVRQVVALLEPGGLSPLDPEAPDSPDEEVFGLKKKLLFTRVQHPAAREGHTLDKLQSFLAEVEAPDHGALKSYCERLGDDAGAVHQALADAAMVFGVKGVTAYLSRGNKAVGIRGYEDKPPFLVIGGRHLEEDSDFHLHPWELRFSVASEVAHLRFQHSRVTMNDVWRGALDKGRLGVDLVLGMVPLLKGVEIIDRIDKIIGRYSKGPLGRAVKGIDLAEKTVTKVRGKGGAGRPKEQMVAATNDKLIAAHRVMQLTADRAGLLLAGDLGAAIRAIFLSNHEYLAELPVVERHGLAKALSRRDDEGEILYQDLAVRVCALISFFLSEDYRVLRAKMTTPPA